MERRQSGLVVAKSIPTMWVKQHYERERVVTLERGPHAGRRARIHVDDSGTVRHLTTDEHQDATVSPRHLTVKVDPNSPFVQRLLGREAAHGGRR